MQYVFTEERINRYFLLKVLFLVGFPCYTVLLVASSPS